ncbi:hypothetical protein GCM10025787_03760 [Saccharopolyspora rosea]|uniref:Uncharacterized protein n=1 Tax=Saccharopolyspora rosea TaxID=524884 RepID=A0ABW3G3X9_9PSEU
MTTFDVVLLAALAAGAYLATCLAWPYTTCRTCRGVGQFRVRLLRAVRICPACQGSGLQLRAGRRAWNRYCRTRQARRRDHHR